jgi:hypothetical protein
VPCTIRSTFIGDFKLGDNICFNLDLLTLLYNHYALADVRGRALLRKPIILILVSITEAVLYDLHHRIRHFTWEGVQNIGYVVADYVRSLRRLDELEKLTVSARKNDFFELADTRFYDDLDQLRRLRNRIHIQNIKGDFEPDDGNAFTDVRKVLAERVLEKTLRTMVSKYDRGPEFNYVGDFVLPWQPYFPD